MTKLLLPLVLIAPFLTAWAVTAIMFGSPTPEGASYAGHTEGFGEVFVSFSIMFAIAIWIGGGFIALSIRLMKTRAE